MYDIDKLRKEQLKLKEKIILKNNRIKFNLIGGCDCVFKDNKIIAVVVILNKKLELIEKKHIISKTNMPSIPGYLFYREGPFIIQAMNLIENKPDFLMVDGNGILHPRKIGIASQIGILLDMPTIGVSKKLIYGTIKEGKAYLKREIRGVEFKTKEHANPIYISPGHKISIGQSIDFVRDSIKPPHKLPEPLYIAHRTAKNISKEEMLY